MSRRRRTGAHYGETKRHGQHGKDSVDDRQPGDEVEGDGERPALLVHETVDHERSGSDRKWDEDIRHAAVDAAAEDQGCNSADRHETAGDPERQPDALILLNVGFHVRNLAFLAREWLTGERGRQLVQPLGVIRVGLAEEALGG